MAPLLGRLQAPELFTRFGLDIAAARRALTKQSVQIGAFSYMESIWVALDLLALGHSLFGRACTRAMWPMPLIGSPSPGTGWTPAAVLWALAQAQAERGAW